MHWKADKWLVNLGICDVMKMGIVEKREGFAGVMEASHSSLWLWTFPVIGQESQIGEDLQRIQNPLILSNSEEEEQIWEATLQLSKAVLEQLQAGCTEDFKEGSLLWEIDYPQVSFLRCFAGLEKLLEK